MDGYALFWVKVIRAILQCHLTHTCDYFDALGPVPPYRRRTYDCRGSQLTFETGEGGGTGISKNVTDRHFSTLTQGHN